MTPELYLLMTNENLERVKVYNDPLNDRYFLCDAEKGTALTDPKRRVRKLEMISSYVQEVTEAWEYNNLATDLATVQSLTFN